jgi:hypothetical protein
LTLVPFALNKNVENFALGIAAAVNERYGNQR